MRVLLIFSGFFFLCTHLFSSTIYVPDNYATIQGAINASAGGDTIIVRPGTFYENIDFVGKAITLESDQGADYTIIDGTQNASVVVFKNGETSSSVLDGFTITNGSAAEIVHYGGGGIHCFNSSPRIINNFITKNFASDDGGGIYCEKASPFISTNVIQFNETLQGGGIYCDGSSPTISNNTIAGNKAKTTVYGLGGGIYCTYLSSPSIRENTITNNLAGSGGGIVIHESAPKIVNNMIGNNLAELYSGGGIYVLGSIIYPAEITGNTITGNTSFAYGGGISCHDNTRPEIEGNLIENNSADYGGGIHCMADASQISGNQIIGNSASTCGGGIHSYFYSYAEIKGNTIKGNSGEDGGGVGCTFGASALLFDNLITENVADENGGGVYCNDNSSPDIDKNVITFNTATFYNCGGIYCGLNSSPTITSNNISNNNCFGSGGGIQCIDNSSPAIINNLITGNTVSAATGGGIYCGYSSTPAIVNNTVYGNSALSGGGIFCYSSRPSIRNSIFWANTPDQIGDPALTVSHCDVQGGFSGPGNINVDPMFVEIAVDDFHLTYNSPCKDAGDNSAPGLPVEDFEGDDRLSGGVVDIGADEFYSHLYHRGSVIPGGQISVRITGTPGKPVTLALGAGVQDPPQSTPYGDLYITYPPAASFSLGNIPATGALVFPANLPSGWQPGEEYPLQALIGPLAPGSVLTNLHVLEVE